MPTDKKLKSLVLNVMTEEQYNSAEKNEDELYLTPDEGGAGGGENYNVVVQRADQERAQKFGVALKWSDRYGLKANTAYEVGDQVIITIDTYNYISANTNQIPVPIDTKVAMINKTRLQFGDVIIVLTDREVRTDLNGGSTSTQSYRFDTEAALRYTVVKAGTTGTDVTLSSGVDIILTYLTYTLGVTKAAQ